MVVFVGQEPLRVVAARQRSRCGHALLVPYMITTVFCEARLSGAVFKSRRMAISFFFCMFEVGADPDPDIYLGALIVVVSNVFSAEGLDI